MFEKWKQRGMGFVRGLLKQYRVISLVFVAAAVGAAGYYVATSGQFAPFQEKVCKSFDLNMSAYEVFVDGQSVGIVEEADSAGQVWVQVVSEINSGEIHYQIPNTLSIEEVEAKPSSFIEPDKLETPIRQVVKSKLKDLSVSAYVLTIDGKDPMTFSTKEEAYALLEMLGQAYVPEGSVVVCNGISEGTAEFLLIDKESDKRLSALSAASMEDLAETAAGEDQDATQLISLSLGQSVQLQEAYVDQSAMTTIEDAYAACMELKEEEQVYTVQSGDCIDITAYNHGMTIQELLAINPEYSSAEDVIHAGDEFVISQSVPSVDIQTVERISYTREEAQPVTYVEDDSQYEDYSEVLEEGAPAVIQVEADVHKRNGVEESREEISTAVVSEAVPKVVKIGTVPRPQFIWPTSGYVSSEFGRRWGRQHRGIDIANSKGTAIYAACSGTVTFAGWKNSYGYVIVINHGNGYETWYAHNSSLAVSAGDSVKQGQYIAAMGSTGNSTGPHCHFEIHENGSIVNPRKYLG